MWRGRHVLALAKLCAVQSQRSARMWPSTMIHVSKPIRESDLRHHAVNPRRRTETCHFSCSGHRGEELRSACGILACHSRDRFFDCHQLPRVNPTVVFFLEHRILHGDFALSAASVNWRMAIVIAISVGDIELLF